MRDLWLGIAFALGVGITALVFFIWGWLRASRMAEDRASELAAQSEDPVWTPLPPALIALKKHIAECRDAGCPRCNPQDPRSGRRAD
jgi:hypothetical protein